MVLHQLAENPYIPKSLHMSHPRIRRFNCANRHSLIFFFDGLQASQLKKFKQRILNLQTHVVQEGESFTWVFEVRSMGGVSVYHKVAL